MANHGIALGADQSAKTKTALECFGARLEEEMLSGASGQPASCT